MCPHLYNHINICIGVKIIDKSSVCPKEISPPLDWTSHPDHRLNPALPFFKLIFPDIACGVA
jgi:hypothetical protein